MYSSGFLFGRMWKVKGQCLLIESEIYKRSFNSLRDLFNLYAMPKRYGQGWQEI